MPLVEFERTFQAAHRLSNNDGKCGRIHGHNFHLLIRIESEYLGGGGFVIDFEKVKRLVDRYDHMLILSVEDTEMAKALPPAWLSFVGQDPTTEFMAQWFADEIANTVWAEDVGEVEVYVKLRETDSISAEASARRGLLRP